MILSVEDSTLFYDLWKPLLQYANKRTKMFPEINFRKDKAIDVQCGCDMAEWIWSHIEIIDDYLKEHPGMKEDHKNILSSWKRCIHDHWFVERHLKSGSVFLGKSPYVFLVQGIVSSFEEMIGMYGTPVMIEATLIPFRDRIITDGLVRAVPIQIGSNMKASMKDEYMAAKKNGSIFTSLTEDVYQTIRERDRIYEEKKQQNNIVQFPLKTAQEEESEENYYDDEDDYYRDDLPEENHEYMTLFLNDLTASNLSPRTIDHHLENIDLFLNEYLWGWKEAHMAEGVGRIDAFFMDFFIDQWFWASSTSVRQTAASIKKFYRSMLNHRKISEKEYQQVEKTIQNRKEEWVMELRRKDEEDEDYDDFF